MKTALALALAAVFTVIPLDAEARHSSRIERSPAAVSTSVINSVPSVSPSSFVAEVESEIFKLINTERTSRGLSALKLDATLAKVARAHSADMAKNNYFSHTSLDGCTMSCRINASGYSWRSIGENIYKMSGYNLTAKEYAAKMVQGWMNSSGHKANILSKTFTHHGVGIAQVGSSIYATDDFALPR